MTAEITDEAFLSAIREVIRLRSKPGHPWLLGASRWDIAAVLAGHPEDVFRDPADYPEVTGEAVLAKARDLIARGFVDGCVHDGDTAEDACRGDFEEVRIVGTAKLLSVTREADGTVTGVFEVPDELVPPRGLGGVSIGPPDLDQPFTLDPDWREKIAKAAEARELGARLREGLPSSFGWPVGERR